ncbi:MAG: hypothetical protein JWN73_2328 [Betaproteobacteria bacterium]|nr:hypothetical protein [Betaproteobacteria bacterium]
MSIATTAITGTIARIEWERFHHATTVLILLSDGRIVHVHSQGLGAAEQDQLLLTREGDEVEADLAQEPEPHVCRYVNRSIAGMAAARA